MCRPYTALSLSQLQFVPERWQDSWLPPTPLAPSPAKKAGKDRKLFLGLSPGIPPDLSCGSLPQELWSWGEQNELIQSSEAPTPQGFSASGLPALSRTTGPLCG